MKSKKELPIIDPNQEITLDIESCDPELKSTTAGYITNVGFVAGIAIAVNEGSWYIPIGHTAGENFDKDEVVEWLNHICSADTDKIFHNAQYDLGWLKKIGVQLHGRIFDTMLAAPLLDENKYSYQLNSLGREYLGEGKYEEALKMAVQEKFGKVKTHKTIIRLKEDVCDELKKYQPFFEAKKRVTQLYDLYPDSVKERYEVLGYEIDKLGHTTYKVPITKEQTVKGLLWAIDPAEMGSYPVQDVDLTRKLAKLFKEKLAEENLTELAYMENELLPALLEMKEHGTRIDMLKAIELDKKYTKELNRLQTEIEEITGYPINIDEDTALLQYCKDNDLPFVRTEKGNPSFSSENIILDDKGFFEHVLAIRKYNKARNTYIRGYIFGMTFNGWLHGQYNQLKSDDGGTVTGRLSSSEPNMQNLPSPSKGTIGKEIRSLFLPDTDKDYWLCMDYSGQEPRMLVDTVLRVEKAYNRGCGFTDGKIHYRILEGSEIASDPRFSGYDADFHTAVSSFCIEEEFKKEGKEIGTEEFNKAVKAFRGKAKSIGLGVMYGSGVQKMADEMTKKGIPMTTAETAEIKSNIYKNVPFLKSLSDLLINKAKSRGYILTILKRRGRFDLWECPIFDKKEKKKAGFQVFKTREEAVKYFRENRDKFSSMRMPQRAFIYKSLNKLIQGSSADQTKMAMLMMYKGKNMKQNSLDIYYRRVECFEPPSIKTQVHDEINISISDKKDATYYQDIMEHCLDMEVEVKAEPVVCTNWGDAK